MHHFLMSFIIKDSKERSMGFVFQWDDTVSACKLRHSKRGG